MLMLIMACRQHHEDAKQLAIASDNDQVLVKNDSSDHAPVVKDAAADSAADRALFAAFLKKFKAAARRNDENALASMMYFPFQTVDWTNDELAAGEVDKPAGRIEKSELHKYYPNIFFDEARQYLSHLQLGDVTEYTDMGGEDYYLTLQRLADKGSPIFEAYAQRDPEVKPDRTIPGLYFAFVFGKVNGAYKAIAYYGKWPVKY